MGWCCQDEPGRQLKKNLGLKGYNSNDRVEITPVRTLIYICTVYIYISIYDIRPCLGLFKLYNSHVFFLSL